MPVVFGPYLERARERLAAERRENDADIENESRKSADESGPPTRPVRTVAAGVALGVALAWVYRRLRG
ncbi:MAG: hypothetical protein ABEJ06_00340 [Haloarculaceae archaeon]